MKIFSPQSGKIKPWKVVFSRPPSWIYFPVSLRYRAAATRYWPVVFLSWRHFLNSHSRLSLSCYCFLTKTEQMSRSPSPSPSPSSSSESYYGYSEESEPESFPEKPLLEIGGYDDTVEPVPTEEELSCRISWAACLGRGGRADFIKSFFRGGRHQRLVCSPCYEIQKLSQYESRE